MTQGARKGKLYQLQVLIDLSSFIISHVPVLGCHHAFDSTILIYFANTSHKGDSPADRVVAGGIETIIVVLIVARVRPEMGWLKTRFCIVRFLLNCNSITLHDHGCQFAAQMG